MNYSYEDTYYCYCYSGPQLDNKHGLCKSTCPDGPSGASCGAEAGYVSVYPVDVCWGGKHLHILFKIK